MTKKINIQIFILIFVLLLMSLQINARYYNPKIGRFITADSATPGDGTDLQGLNRYSYCNNNPIKYIDTIGHKPRLFMESEINPVKETSYTEIIADLDYEKPFGFGIGYTTPGDYKDPFIEHYTNIGEATLRSRLYLNNEKGNIKPEYFLAKFLDVINKKDILVGKLSLYEQYIFYYFNTGNIDLKSKIKLDLVKALGISANLYAEPSLNIMSGESAKLSKMKAGFELGYSKSIGDFTPSIKLGLYEIYKQKNKIIAPSATSNRLDLKLQWNQSDPGTHAEQDYFLKNLAEIRAKFDFSAKKEGGLLDKITIEANWDINKKERK